MELNNKHQKAIALLFEGNLTKKQIAEELKITERTLYNWTNDLDFVRGQKEYSERQLNKYAPKAIRTLHRLLDAESENVQLGAAKDILDRTGFKAKDELELSGGLDIKNQYSEMSDEELEELTKRYEKINDS